MIRYLFLFSCLLLFISLYAQRQENKLETAISFTAKNELISSILTKIEKEQSIRFAYNPKLINVNNQVTLSVQKMPLRLVLFKLFNGNVQCKQNGSIIILTYKAPVNPSPQKKKSEEIEIIGYVYDQDGERLPQVSIYNKTYMLSSVSNEYGYYMLKIPADKLPIKLSIVKQQYKDTSILVSSALEDQNIIMYAATKRSIKPIEISLDTFTKSTITPIVLNADSPVTANQTDTLKHFFQKKFFQDLVVSSGIQTNLKNITDTLFTKTQVSLIPFISTNKLLSGNTINDYSFNILVGYSQGLNKMELGGLANIDRENVRSFQAAGLFNAVGGNLDGIQLAGFGNITRGNSNGIVAAGLFNIGTNMHGFQAAGLTNINFSLPKKTTNSTFREWMQDTVYGIQAAGLVNINAGYMEGFQAAGLVNLNGNGLNGIQGAGLVNIGNNLTGFQLAGLANGNYGKVNGVSLAGLTNVFYDSLQGYAIAGLVNTNTKNVKGFQIAGLVNIATHDVEGMQIASILNIAEHVNGTQIGLLNFSDSSYGLPIGLMTYVKSGYHKLEFFTNDLLLTQMAWRTGVPHFHNIFTLGVDLTRRVDGLWNYGYGVGSTFNLKPKWNITTDIIAQQYVKGKLQNAPLGIDAFIGIEKQLSKNCAIAFGPTYHTMIQFGTQNEYTTITPKIIPYSFYEKNYANGNSLNMWVGAKLSIKFF